MIAHEPPARTALISALAACADSPVRARARRFLRGLSADELGFIAGFVGACILKSSENTAHAAESLEHECRIGGSGPGRRDREHKMILLREFLRRSRRHTAPARRAGPAAA
jgi:hypothetical protein